MSRRPLLATEAQVTSVAPSPGTARWRGRAGRVPAPSQSCRLLQEDPSDHLSGHPCVTGGPEPRPQHRLRWVKREAPVGARSLEGISLAAGGGGRAARPSICVTVLRTDEMCIAPSGAFGGYRQNNSKDLF